MNGVGVLGVPFDANSSFLRGPSAGPAAIRAALHIGSANAFSEDGLDLSSDGRLVDLGDVAFGADDVAGDMLGIEQAAGRALAQGGMIALGGDHSITAALVRAHAATHGPLTILHVDAHPDLYDALDGNRNSHGSPFARIMEEGLASRLVQVGIRGSNAHQREQAARFGVETHEMRSLDLSVDLRLTAPLYVSIDLDALDPAFAPGVSHHEPGGMSTRDLIGLLQGLPVAPVGADIVELNPMRDVQGMTAMVGAKVLKELVATMLR